jgi:hypothetical protein
MVMGSTILERFNDCRGDLAGGKEVNQKTVHSVLYDLYYWRRARSDHEASRRHRI